MKKISQKTVVCALVAVGVLVSSLALATTGNVANTVHNFMAGAANGGQFVDNIGAPQQVCIYCHTPHNAGQSRLLWNKSTTTTALTFKFYSSDTATRASRQQTSFAPDSPSLLCLGCHDGKSAMNVLHSGGKGGSASGYQAGSNYSFGTAGVFLENPPPSGFTPPTEPMIGGPAGTTVDLTDDHPVGFSYKAVYDERTTKGTTAGLHSPGTAVTNSGDKIRLFGGVNQNVECSSCHDPHVDSNITPALKPFLVMSNSGSNLCLSCHDK